MHALQLRAFGAQLNAVVDAARVDATNVAARSIDAGATDARAALAEIPLYVAAIDRALNRFRADSEIARLNRDGVVVDASDELLRGVATAVDVAGATDGLVTPTIHDALCAAGYTASFDGMASPARSGATRCMTSSRATRHRGSRGIGPIECGPVPDWQATVVDVEARTIRAPCGPVPDWRATVVDVEARTIRAPCALDVGGTAKGAFADAAAARLARSGPALVDVGGDIAVSGPRRGGAPWVVDVAGVDVGVVDRVALVSGGVATSGRDHRRWQGGHHIIDPRTGAPARTDVLTVTVVAPTALEAEVMAKVVLLLGRDDGLRAIDARDDLAALVIDDAGLVHRSRAFTRFTLSPAAAAADARRQRRTP